MDLSVLQVIVRTAALLTCGEEARGSSNGQNDFQINFFPLIISKLTTKVKNQEKSPATVNEKDPGKS